MCVMLSIGVASYCCRNTLGKNFDRLGVFVRSKVCVEHLYRARV